MSLNIVPTDILTQTGNIFNPIWALLVIGLGLILAPSIIQIVRNTFGNKYEPAYKVFRIGGRRTIPSMRKGFSRKGVWRKRRYAGSVIGYK